MKKILILIILCCFYTKVNAETFYGEYFKTNSIDGLENDLIKIENHKLYNTYKIEYEDMGYLEENDIYIKEEKDYIIDERITNKLDNYEEIITINTTFDAQMRIYFKNFSRFLKLYEVEIYYNDELIDYVPSYPTNFPQPELNKLNDKNFDTYYENTTDDDSYYMSFYLKKRYLLNKLKFIIYTKENDDMKLTMLLESDKPIVLNNNVDRKHIIVFNVVDTLPENEIEYLYVNKNILYKYYKELKIPTNNYVYNGDNIIIDDYIVNNEYYRRNKLVLKDEIIIDDKNLNIEDFIEYASSTPTVLCDINYKINGIYKCKFLLDGLEVEKDVTLNLDDIQTEEVVKDNIENSENEEQEIEEIVIEEIEEKKEETSKEEFYNKITDSVKLMENEKEISKKIIGELNKEIKNDKKYINIKNNDNENESNLSKIKQKEIEVTTIKNKIREEDNTSIIKETKEKEKSKLIKIIIFIILIIFNVFCLIKRKRNNVESI